MLFKSEKMRSADADDGCIRRDLHAFDQHSSSTAWRFHQVSLQVVANMDVGDLESGENLHGIGPAAGIGEVVVPH